jgi:hypothetical protein
MIDMPSPTKLEIKTHFKLNYILIIFLYVI